MKFVEILLLQCGEVLGGLTLDELGFGIEAGFQCVVKLAPRRTWLFKSCCDSDRGWTAGENCLITSYWES